MRVFAPLLCCLVLTLASCASAPKVAAPTYAGTWDVQVKDTPLGDVTGELILTGVDEELAGRFVANGTSYDLKRANRTEDGISLSFYFADQGIDVDMNLKGTAASGSLVGNTLGEYLTTAIKRKATN